MTTDQYVLGHVFGTGLGLILAIFGAVALGVWLSQSRVGRLGVVAMVLTVFGSGIFLLLTGVSAFTAPGRGRLTWPASRGSRICHRALPTGFLAPCSWRPL